MDEPANVSFCTREASLIDELSKVSEPIDVVVIGCLEGIINQLHRGKDPEKEMRVSMDLLHRAIDDLLGRVHQMKVFLFKPVVTKDETWNDFSEQAMVTTISLVKRLEREELKVYLS